VTHIVGMVANHIVSAGRGAADRYGGCVSTEDIAAGWGDCQITRGIRLEISIDCSISMC